MHNRQERTLATFHRVLDYLDRHVMKPEPPMLGSLRTSLETSVTRIRELGHEQYNAKVFMSGSVEHRVRNLRRTYMMPLVRIARPLLSFAPGVEATLTVPHARADALTVAAGALRMCNALAPHHKLLADAGCSRDYMQKFKDEAKALALAANHTQSKRQRRSQLTAEIAVEFKKAMETVTIIEGIVMLHAGGERSRMQHWKTVRRVSRRMGRPKARGKRGNQPRA